MLGYTQQLSGTPSHKMMLLECMPIKAPFHIHALASTQHFHTHVYIDVYTMSAHMPTHISIHKAAHMAMCVAIHVSIHMSAHASVQMPMPNVHTDVPYKISTHMPAYLPAVYTCPYPCRRTYLHRCRHTRLCARPQTCPCTPTRVYFSLLQFTSVYFGTLTLSPRPVCDCPLSARPLSCPI